MGTGCQAVVGDLSLSKNSSTKDTASDSNVYSQEKERAFVVATDYLTKLTASDYQGALPLYHDRWYQNMDKTATQNFLKDLDERLGTMSNSTLESWETARYEEVSGGRSGIYVTLVYTVKRQKFEGKETVVLIRSLKDENFWILSHDVISEGFDKQPAAQ